MSGIDTAVAGYGDYVDKDNANSVISYGMESTRIALEDANLNKEDIDAVFTKRRPVADMRPQWNNIFSDYLHIPTKMTTEVTSHGAGINGMLRYATAAINAGYAETVLCVTCDSYGQAGDRVEGTSNLDGDDEFEIPYGHMVPAMYGIIAQRYLAESDATAEDMARLAVEARRWALEHPDAWAQGRGTISVEDVLSSPPIASPFNRLDCAPWGQQGRGGAFIVTEADRAEELHREPIYIRGTGEYNTHEHIATLPDISVSDGGEPTLRTGAKYAAQQAYAEADLEPSDIDVAELHTNFTAMGLMELEDMGFCEENKAGQFVRNGGIDFEGGLPINTTGGHLGFGQHATHIMDLIVEAIRQLRGEAVGKQVRNPETALVQGAGGMCACNTVSILSNER